MPLRRLRSPAAVSFALGVALLLAFSLVPAGTVRGGGAGVIFETSSLVIESASGRHSFTVEMAVTSAQRKRGLMFRKELPADAGMLFVYGRERRIEMWMKNTFLSLDMLFLDRAGQVRRIARNAKPFSRAIISSLEPALAVLEVPAGTADRLGIVPGDKVIHPIFQDPSAEDIQSGL